jgi:3-keto-5-aminohexanoate cleavage enzyme
MIPSDAVWGFVHEGAPDLRLTAAALGMGATVVRVGYEDSGYLRPGVAADSNARLVDSLVTMIHSAGLDVATVEEAKVLLRMDAHNSGPEETR